ncbi:MAG: hypothetical protein V1738_00510 [Patescibacteria group bacterium]
MALRDVDDVHFHRERFDYVDFYCCDFQFKCDILYCFYQPEDIDLVEEDRGSDVQYDHLTDYEIRRARNQKSRRWHHPDATSWKQSKKVRHQYLRHTHRLPTKIGGGGCGTREIMFDDSGQQFCEQWPTEQNDTSPLKEKLQMFELLTNDIDDGQYDMLNYEEWRHEYEATKFVADWKKWIGHFDRMNELDEQEDEWRADAIMYWDRMDRLEARRDRGDYANPVVYEDHPACPGDCRGCRLKSYCCTELQRHYHGEDLLDGSDRVGAEYLSERWMHCFAKTDETMPPLTNIQFNGESIDWEDVGRRIDAEFLALHLTRVDRWSEVRDSEYDRLPTVIGSRRAVRLGL